jgi:hypothetical protein
MSATCIIKGLQDACHAIHTSNAYLYHVDFRKERKNRKTNFYSRTNKERDIPKVDKRCKGTIIQTRNIKPVITFASI